MKSSICRGLCLYLCGELRHFFFRKAACCWSFKETQWNPVLQVAGEVRQKKMKEVILMVKKNYTIHMNLGNLAILWQGRCLHLGNPKISCCPKSRMKTDPKHDDWHFGILTCLIWAQELCWDPVSSKEGNHNLQSKLKFIPFALCSLMLADNPTHESYTASICQEDSEETCSETCYHFCCQVHEKDTPGIQRNH